jgi:hypothetical protein
VEGLKGASNLRMAGALMGLGRYRDGVYHLQYYIEYGGKLYGKGFRLAEDKALEEKMGAQLKYRPHDNDLLISAAVYAYSRGDLDGAGRHIATLRTVNPYHPCLEALERSLQKEEGEK